jgi:hypothetical protein
MEDRKIQKLKNKIFSNLFYLQEKYLQIDASALISQVTFSANECMQHQHHYISRIYSRDSWLTFVHWNLEDDDCYVYLEDTNYVMAGYEQASQFLILPVDGQ